MKLLIGATALAMIISGAAFAQTLPNTGPAGNPQGDSFGKIYSGARPLPNRPQRYKTTTHRHKKIKRHRTRR